MDNNFFVMDRPGVHIMPCRYGGHGKDRCSGFIRVHVDFNTAISVRVTRVDLNLGNHKMTCGHPCHITITAM